MKPMRLVAKRHGRWWARAQLAVIGVLGIATAEGCALAMAAA
jgi:hypothetical protein